MKLKVVLSIVLMLAFVLAGNSQQTDSAYLFSHFVNNGEDGLHLAYSEDGLNWQSLKGNHSFLKPDVGGDKLMRDPCIIQTPDDIFHMVWTVSWGEKGIGYAWSKDLIHWSDQHYIPVMEHEPGALNCWAPEIFYDAGSGLYMVYWSTTIPGRFPATDHPKDKNNHRIYYVTSRDMISFSETALLYDPGFNVIDGTIFKHGDNYNMFIKDETRYPEAQKNIRISTSQSLTGPYSPASEPIYDLEWAEGPTLLKADDRWILFFDLYRSKKMGAVSSRDLNQWEDISDQVHFPEGTRHGTVLKVSGVLLNSLLELKSKTHE